MNQITKFNYLVALIIGIAIPTSTALLNLSLALIPLSVLISKELRVELKLSLSLWFVRFALLLYLLFLIRSIDSSAPIADIKHMLIKMLPLVVLPFAYAFFTAAKNRRIAFYAFLAAVIVTLVLSYLSWAFKYPILHGRAWGGTPTSAAWGANTWAPFEAHTYHCYFLGLASVVVLELLLRHKLVGKLRYLGVLFIALVTINIFYLISSRTGQLAYLMMLVTTLILWRPRRGLIISISLLIIGLPLLLVSSPAIQKKILQAKTDLVNYQNNDNSGNSIGLRLTYHKYAKELITHKPFIGYGTGSYSSEYATIAKYDEINTSGNPHNDYLWMGVELGLGGVLFLVLLILSLIFTALRLNASYKNAGIILALTYAIICIENSFFTDSISGIAFILISAFIISSKKALGANNSYVR